MSANELMVTPVAYMMPAMRIEDVIERRNQMVQFVEKAMRKDVDFGVIPGTGTKPTLYKPGAEKLCTLFALAPRFTAIEHVADWTGETHNGEPFFYYHIKCALYYRGEVFVGEADGSCNSWEKKYRYRKAERVCPLCGKDAIKKSKFPPRDNPRAKPGWYCYDKAGGCGANFPAGDPQIENQEAGQVPNPDVADQANTILKMAEKRALVAATLIAVNASEFFTQDIEDLYIEGEARVIVEKPYTAVTAAISTTVNAQTVEVQSPAPKPEPVPENAVPTGPGFGKDESGHVTQPGNGNGKVVRAVVQTPKWSELIQRAIQAGYVPDNTTPSAMRLLTVVGKAGIQSVNNLNLDEVWQTIAAHYEAKREAEALQNN